ncbi:MAG: sarcosine oxidase subunit gamma family protein [Pseudomonadales bacterium]
MQTSQTHLTTARSLLYRSSQGASTPTGAAVALRDFSLNLRYGFRGPSAQAYLQDADLSVPSQPNCALATPGGQQVLRLSNTEFWVIHPESTQTQPLLDTADGEGCYSLYNRDSHAWLVLSGCEISSVMAKLCAVDLRTEHFALGAIAQTSVARVNAIVVHHELEGESVFSLFSDSASASYLWSALQDAMGEFK